MLLPVLLLGGSSTALFAQSRAILRTLTITPNHGREPAPEPLPTGAARMLHVRGAQRGVRLECALFEPPGAPRGTVLVLHGIHSGKRHMSGLGRRLAANGFRALSIDLPGHGGSSGERFGYGVTEARDLKRVIDYLAARSLLVRPLAIHGPSYGGAVAIQTAALDPRVDGVVAVATFRTLRDLTEAYFHQMSFGLGAMVPAFVIDRVVSQATENAGVAVAATDNRRALRRTRARVLIMHSDSDDLLPFVRSRDLARACPSTRCSFVRLRGLDHMGSLRAVEPRRRAIAFYRSLRQRGR